jgi:murein peptide amidase A
MLKFSGRRLFLIGLLLFGCSPSRTTDLLLIDPEAVFGTVVGRSVENRPIDLFEMGSGDEVILIIASIHGNEKAGTPLVRQLMRFLLQNPVLLDIKKVLVIPVSNPDGFYRHSRFNANGVDLNRNFPASNRVRNVVFGLEPMSEPETRAIIQVIDQFAPDRIITLHQPLHCIDYDGPALQLAEYLTRYGNLPLRRLGAKPGSLGSYAGEDLSIPTVTVELPASVEYMSVRELWERFGDLLLSAIHYPAVHIETIQVVK